MKKEDIKACIMRVGGTNCDKETKRVFDYLKVGAEVVHTNQFIKGKKDLEDYHVLIFPGGFSNGDYIRAGAIWASTLKTELGLDLKKFYDSEKPIAGFCNGFQVLVELGLLPAFNGISKYPEAVLTTNDSTKYECRLVYLFPSNKKAIATKSLNKIIPLPIGHGEGKFLINNKKLEQLLENDQIVFRYAKPDGSIAKCEYPYNPNGSLYDIAGICDPHGTVLGMMPHPERYAFPWQYYDWTRNPNIDFDKEGVGLQIFKNIVNYVERKF